MNQSLYRTALLRRTLAVLACGLPAAWAALAMAASLRDATGILRPAASIPIAGRVTGADGQGLPGVPVLVRGTSTGTGADGSFSLTAPEGSTLLFSFVGFVAQSVVVTSANASNVSVRLVESAQGLNEIVVVGYGTQERQDVTGAISSPVVLNGADPTRAQNNDLSRENDYQANIGVDLGLFQNRIELSVDV